MFCHNKPCKKSLDMNFILDVGGVQEGGLTDVAIEVLHRLLTHVVHGPRDQVGVGDDQVTAFLETLKKGVYLE